MHALDELLQATQTRRIDRREQGMMKRHSCSAAALFVCITTASMPAQAQCVECAQQMFQATLTGNAWYNINQETIEATRRMHGLGTAKGSGRKSTQPRPEGVSEWALEQARSEILFVLRAEYRHRRLDQGNGNAGQWLNTAAGDIGRQVAALKPEYLRRCWDADGSDSADTWFRGSARKIAERYASGHRGPGMGEAVIGRVPAATRQRAEDATLAVLAPEISRIERSQGHASAAAWARDMGLAVGSGVRNLAPEYALHAKAEGQTSADRWYVDQATQLARLQVAHGR